MNHYSGAARAGGRAFSVSIGILAAVSIAFAKPASKPASPPGGLQNLGFTGQGIYVSLPDPKRAGRMLWKLWAKNGQFGPSSGKGYTVTAEGVTALLFQAGRLDAKMTAPQARGDTAQQTIVASGGVTYVSLSQPGTILRARTITWHAGTGRGVARGNVDFHGKNGLTARTPVLYFDTNLRTVSSEPLGR